MVLVDTSVFIDFFKGSQSEGVRKLENLIIQQTPFGITELIYLELLQGSKNQREFELLKDFLSTQNFYYLKNGNKSYEEAAYLYTCARNKGFTIRSTVDVIIAQIAIENHLFLLHQDRDFSRLAEIEPRLQEF